MFKSARTQLTLFYLLILVALSLVVTTSVRVLSEREYLRSNMVQRGVVLRLPDWDGAQFNVNTNRFVDLQEAQQAFVRQRLNQELVAINIMALAVGGLLSYWFAGRTLRPIEEAHEAQARFAADASHELRTPLTNMQLENEVFLRQPHFSETEARELIASNLEEVQRLDGLSASLLALAQYGHTPLKTGPANIAGMVAEAVALATKTAAARHVVLQPKVAKARVVGNRESLVQLLGILIDNAIKYGPASGTVLVGGRRHNGQYELWVEDQGPGIATADMPHIFDRLYRGDKARSATVPGYGLGLSLAKAIAAANAAELTAGNNSGRAGARFTLRLPLV